jgi:hypothetical protein
MVGLRGKCESGDSAGTHDAIGLETHRASAHWRQLSEERQPATWVRAVLTGRNALPAVPPEEEVLNRVARTPGAAHEVMRHGSA